MDTLVAIGAGASYHVLFFISIYFLYSIIFPQQYCRKFLIAFTTLRYVLSIATLAQNVSVTCHMPHLYFESAAGTTF
jgi:hypothetical protein